MEIIYYLYFLFALDAFGGCLALPIYTEYILNLGGTTFVLSLIGSTTALISLISNNIIGSLSDSNGRTTLLKKCLLCGMVANILYAIAPSWHFVFLGKIIAAFGSSIGTLEKALLADNVASENTKKLFFQKSMLVQGIMTVFVSGFSGYISELKYGFNFIYFLIAVPYTLSIVVITTKFPNDTKKRRHSKNISLATRSVQELKAIYWNIKSIDWPIYWDIFVMRTGTEIGFSIFSTNMAVFLIEEYNIKGSACGNFWMFTGTFVILANLLKIRLTKLYPTSNDYLTIAKSATILAFSFLSVGVIPSIYVVFLSVVLMAGSGSFLVSTYYEMLTIRTQESDRGKVLGSFENVVLIAQFVVPFISGLLSLVLSLRMLIALSFIPPFFTALLAYKQVLSTKNSVQKSQTKTK